MRTILHDDTGADRRQTTQLEPLISDDEAVREIGAIAREALSMALDDIGLDSPRGQAFLARKRALKAYIEARR